MPGVSSSRDSQSASERKVAFVTGSGAPRVGNAIARRLAAMGFRIALHANTSLDHAEQTAAELQDQGVETRIVSGSLEDAARAETLVDEVVSALGRIDVLVNSAAIWYPTPLEEITADEVRRYFEINTLSTFMAARAAGLRMVGQPEGGVIVNISDWAIARPYLDHAAYFPSKGAVESLTRSLAVELAERNRHVRVNCIRPGPVLLAEEMPEAKRQAVEQSTLLKRVGTAEHIAHAVQFLVENDFVTGISLPVDGGRTIYANDPLQTTHRTG